MCPERALMLSVLLAAAAATRVYIGTRVYDKWGFWKEGGAQARIVAVGDVLIYSKRSNFQLNTLRIGDRPQPVEELRDVHVWDVLLAPSGAVWVATRAGLFQYNVSTNTVSNMNITNRSVTNMATTATGALYIVDATMRLYSIQGWNIHTLTDIQTFYVTFSKNGSVLYHTTGERSPIFRKSEHPWAESGIISGIPTTGLVTFLEIDWRDDTLYICHTEGLYYVHMWSSAALQVERITGEVWGIGFSVHGDVYIGTTDTILKLCVVETEGKKITPNKTINIKDKLNTVVSSRIKKPN